MAWDSETEWAFSLGNSNLPRSNEDSDAVREGSDSGLNYEVVSRISMPDE
jgi:hypothetical protein